jgi:hypothetical protein
MISSITYLSDLAERNPDNDNIDVHIVLDDGRQYTFVVATPNNVFWCMDNEGLDYLFGEPMIFVKNLASRTAGDGFTFTDLHRRLSSVQGWAP